MRKRLMAGPVVLVTMVASLAVAGAARAETCVPLPGTTGATIEVGSQKIRVPSTSGVAACYEPSGLPGLPRVESAGSTVSLILGGGSTGSGYVAVRYSLDGAANEIQVPIPGGGRGYDTCLASVGAPARSDCLVKVSLDDIPDPPPTPTAPPTPTVPPPPTAPPTPTVEPINPRCNEYYCVKNPVPMDPWCNDHYCIPPLIDPICLTNPEICVP